MEDAPPVAQPQQMSAEQLARHPVWLNSRSGQASPMPNARQRIPQGASKGGAKKKGTAAGADDYDAPRFERISAEALEMKAFQDMDGADSHLNSDDSDEDYAQVSADRRARENGPRRERRRQNDEGEDDDDEERPAGPLDEEDDAEEERSEHEMAASSGKKRRGGSGGVGSARGSGSAEDMMAAAAFGGGARRAFGESEADGRSETSSKRRKTAYKEAFPVRGVTCVGCAIATRITPVERFVKENIGRMTETALWKMAALCYKKDVAEPCEREGVVVPGEHFEFEPYTLTLQLWCQHANHGKNPNDTLVRLVACTLWLATSLPMLEEACASCKTSNRKDRGTRMVGEDAQVGHFFAQHQFLFGDHFAGCISELLHPKRLQNVVCRQLRQSEGLVYQSFERQQCRKEVTCLSLTVLTGSTTLRQQAIHL
tara:strand:- start:3403 stop:4686 length:1284 start_codon:yes stop_codon:yes gene_type:complete